MFHNARHFRHIICNASVEMCVCVLKGCPKSYTFLHAGVEFFVQILYHSKGKSFLL